MGKGCLFHRRNSPPDELWLFISAIEYSSNDLELWCLLGQMAAHSLSFHRFSLVKANLSDLISFLLFLSSDSLSWWMCDASGYFFYLFFLSHLRVKLFKCVWSYVWPVKTRLASQRLQNVLGLMIQTDCWHIKNWAHVSPKLLTVNRDYKLSRT